MQAFCKNIFIFFRAVDESRTRNIRLGRATLYQLSYYRITEAIGFEPMTQLFLQSLIFMQILKNLAVCYLCQVTVYFLKFALPTELRLYVRQE